MVAAARKCSGKKPVEQDHNLMVVGVNSGLQWEQGEGPALRECRRRVDFNPGLEEEGPDQENRHREGILAM